MLRGLQRRLLAIYDINTTLKFIIGKPVNDKDSGMEEKIKIEQLKYRDVEIGDFIDIYENLAQKTLFSYEIALQQKMGSMMLFQDDDCLITYQKLERYIHYKTPKDIYCFADFSGK